MNLNYQLTFGKFKGHTLKDIADNNPWYLNWIVKMDWFKTKLKTELSKEDFRYLANAQNKYNAELDNQRIVNSYFPNGRYSNDNDDDYSNFCGVHGFL